MKSKPLIFGAIAVIALLIAGLIYFFITKDSDPEVDTNTQNTTEDATNTDQDAATTEDDGSAAGEETNTDQDAATTEDDGSAVLTGIGFECQTTTIAAEAAVRVAAAEAIAAEDPGAAVFAQLYADSINESGAADNEILKCSHAEKQMVVIVTSETDANLHLMALFQSVCTAVASDGITAEASEMFLQNTRDEFAKNAPSVIGSMVYIADGASPEVQQELKTLFQAEGIEHTPVTIPELTCAN